MMSAIPPCFPLSVVLVSVEPESCNEIKDVATLLLRVDAVSPHPRHPLWLSYVACSRPFRQGNLGQ